MSTTPDDQLRFDLAKFNTLQGEELYEYMHPFMWSADSIVDPNDVAAIASQLSSYNDEYHLVYAIELGADHQADLFAGLIPPFLSHKEQSVRLAASRALERLPERVVTTHLLNAVETALKSCPESDHMQKLTERFKTILAPQ